MRTSLRSRMFEQYPNAIFTHGSETTPARKALGPEKSHVNAAIAITGATTVDEVPKNGDDSAGPNEEALYARS